MKNILLHPSVLPHQQLVAECGPLSGPSQTRPVSSCSAVFTSHSASLTHLFLQHKGFSLVVIVLLRTFTGCSLRVLVGRVGTRRTFTVKTQNQLLVTSWLSVETKHSRFIRNGFYRRSHIIINIIIDSGVTERSIKEPVLWSSLQTWTWWSSAAVLWFWQ